MQNRELRKRRPCYYISRFSLCWKDRELIMHRIHYVCKFPVIVLLIFVFCFGCAYADADAADADVVLYWKIHSVYRVFSITRSFTCFAYKWAYDTNASSFRSTEQIYLHNIQTKHTHTPAHQHTSVPAHKMREDEEKKKLNQKTKRNGRRIQKTKQDGNGWQNIAEERVESTFGVKTKRVQTKLLKNHHIKYLPPPECTDDVVANNNQ